MTPFNPIVVVGLGGIGSHLVEPLARYLAAQDAHPCRLVLVDGDSYNRPNMARQRVSEDDIGENKTSSHAGRLRLLFPNLVIVDQPVFLTEENVGEIVPDRSCVFACVDNHATRKLLSDAMLRLKDALLVSGGNDITDGNVQVFWRVAGRNRTPPLDQYHPEIKYPADVNPARLTCEDLAMLPPSRQILMANHTVASLMLNAFHTLTTTGRLGYAEVYFDILQNAVNPRPRR